MIPLFDRDRRLMRQFGPERKTVVTELPYNYYPPEEIIYSDRDLGEDFSELLMNSDVYLTQQEQLKLYEILKAVRKKTYNEMGVHLQQFIPLKEFN